MDNLSDSQQLGLWQNLWEFADKKLESDKNLMVFIISKTPQNNTQASPTEKSLNKDLTATQQVASPKCPSDTSLNPNIKSNFFQRSKR